MLLVNQIYNSESNKINLKVTERSYLAPYRDYQIDKAPWKQVNCNSNPRKHSAALQLLHECYYLTFLHHAASYPFKQLSEPS